MVLRRVRWAPGLAALLATVAAGGLRAGDKSPESVLKGHDLKRVGSTYVLAVAESGVQRKVNQLKLLSGQLNLALQQQEAFELGTQDREAMLQQLRQEHRLLGEQIQAMDQQIRGMTVQAGGNNYTSTLGGQMIAQRNQAVFTYNSLGDRIRLLQSQGSDPRVQKEILAEVPRRREAYTQAVLDLRQLVDQTLKAYDELARDDEIKRALDAINRTAKAKLKLGPSRQFQDNVKLLERIEKSVITDAVELRRTGGGVYEVDVTFNSKVTRPMIFDTGAAVTTIPASLAAEIGLKVSPDDPDIRCQTADGTVVIAKQKTIPSMRVGRFIVNDVVCAVMPASKGDVEPLLGQSFHRHFTYKMTPGSGHLVMSTVDTLEQPKAKTGGRLPKAAAKGQRTARSRSAAGKSKAAGGPDGG